MVRDDEEEALKKKHSEEALDRNAKATIQSHDYTCSVRWAKLFIKKEPLVKQIMCEKCGKVFKTNRNTRLCLSCEKKK
jgi:hypothetical protein